MNLLTDDWIPVQERGEFQYISLKRLLCEEKEWQLCSHRDDMELATLQLAVCLTQVVFMPENENSLRDAWETPMEEAQYAQGIEKYLDWFDLLHPKTPFMQIKGTQAKESTPIQKIFTGLPEGNNHAFFNEVGEVHSMGLPEVAVALFNQNANAPGFSGKQKAGLRGAAPLSTLIMGDSLRQTIWVNVLHKKIVESLYPGIEDKPVWVEPIVALSGIDDYIKRTKPKTNAHLRKVVYANSIGFIRGLFWLPVLIELVPTFCKDKNEWVVDRFKIGSDFYFEMKGVWPHPHSPRKWQLEKGDEERKSEYFLSFTTTAPAWTHLSALLINKESDKEGTTPAPVITQYQNLFRGKPLHMIVGGYRNRQALILQRRHELFSLKKGWESSFGHLIQLINIGLECKKTLRSKLYYAGKELGIKGLGDAGEKQFYKQSENLIYSSLRMLNWEEAGKQVELFKKQVLKLGKEIFDELLRPYEHDPKLVKIIIKVRSSLTKSLSLI